MLVLSVVYFVLGTGIEDDFFTDPIGSGLWVKGIAVCLIILSLLLLVFPTHYTGQFPTIKEWLNRIPFALTTVLYALLLPLIGFFISTFLAVTAISLLFNARFVPALLSAAIMTIATYIVFDVLLGINLPAGHYFK